MATARATLARLIAAAFGEPDAILVSGIRDPAIQQEVNEAAEAVGIGSDLVAGTMSALDGNPDLEAEALRLMGHTVRSACPPYELEYRTAEVFQQSQTLADIAGFYRAFGFDATGPLTERADHITAEWEFLAVLAMKEALAGSDAQRTCCLDAQRTFLAEHAGVWMPAFFERIRRADAGSFLARVADLGDVVLRQWCADRNARLGPTWLELRPLSEDDAAITCGAPGAVELGPTLAAAMNGGAET